MSDQYTDELEARIFRKTPEGLALTELRDRWPFPEPVPAHKRPAAAEKQAESK